MPISFKWSLPFGFCNKFFVFLILSIHATYLSITATLIWI
jgi:hypothetical protein